jgi:tetratricopeptide (TPR) repeat protein
MRLPIVKALLIVAAGHWLAGCNLTSDVGGMFTPKRGSDEARATMPPPSASSETTGSIAPRRTVGMPSSEDAAPEISAPSAPATAAPLLPGADGKDDVARGREQYRAGNYAEAESAFDHAAKMNPRDAEAWLGLAACYDRMRRFELADRAYVQALGIKGPIPEILNNQGYSYLLRGDLQRARTALNAALKKDPGNKYVQNNLQLLESKERSARAQ